MSADDEINALAQTTRLAALRGHSSPSREDLLDGVRSSFIKGAVDVEGVLVLTHARTVLAGMRVGAVPKAAGLPPLVWDFRETATRFRLNLDGLENRTTTLDLYRKGPHRLLSRFLHRLRYLNTPFAVCERGPDFVLGQFLDRMQEVWSYRWSPMTEAHLIEMSMYGSTLEQAAIARLLARFRGWKKPGKEAAPTWPPPCSWKPAAWACITRHNSCWKRSGNCSPATRSSPPWWPRSTNC